LLALEIVLNGRKVVLAGADDLAVLNGIVNAVGKLGRKTSGTKANPSDYDLWLTVGGLTARVDGTPDEHLLWVGRKKLKIGDKVEIRVCKVAVADYPEESSPAESKKQERLQYKLVKSQYMKLRKKFEKQRANKTLQRTRADSGARR
jgi:hypothetical protein